MSHVKHVRFVGGRAALKRALGSELVEASLELTSGPQKSSEASVAEPKAPCRSTPACCSRSTSCSAVTGYKGDFAVEKLRRSADVVDLRQPPLQGRRQARDLRRRDARVEALADQRRRALRQAPRRGAARRGQGRDGRSLAARLRRQRIVAVAAVDLPHGVVIELTCGLDQCRDADQAAALLKRMLARADRLGQPAVKSSEPPTEKPTEEPDPRDAEERAGARGRESVQAQASRSSSDEARRPRSALRARAAGARLPCRHARRAHRARRARLVAARAPHRSTSGARSASTSRWRSTAARAIRCIAS